MLKGPASSRAFFVHSIARKRDAAFHRSDAKTTDDSSAARTILARAAVEQKPERAAEPFLKGFDLEIALTTENGEYCVGFPAAAIADRLLSQRLALTGQASHGSGTEATGGW